MKKVLIFLFAAFISINAQVPPEIKNVDQQIVSLTYNYEFNKAENLLKDQLNKYPDTPKYYFLKIGTELIKAIKTRDEAVVSRKREITDSINSGLIAYAEKAIEKFEDRDLSLDEKFYLGGIYGYIGRMKGIEGSWMSAFSYSKDGKNIVEEVIEKNPKYYDAYLLLGMQYYYADRMSGIVGLVAGILGFSGDREKGLEYIKISSEKGELTYAQATLLLFELYSRLEDNEFASFPYFENFLKNFPRNEHVLNWYCRELIDVYQLDKVEEVIANDSLKLIDPYVKGIYYHYAGDYGKSNTELIYVLNNKEKYFNWYYDNAVFQYLINQLAVGNQQEINKYINKLSDRYKINFNQLSANKKLAEKFIEYEKLIASNGDKNKVREIGIELLLEKKNTFYTAAYNFLSGVAKFKNEKYKDAAGDFTKNVYSDNDFYQRESIKYLMEIYSRIRAEENLVENLIDQIDDLDNDRLSFRARDLEKKYGL